jgi:hypothetical protein
MSNTPRTSVLEAPGFIRRIGELSGKSDLVWFLAMNVGLGFTLIAAYLFPFSPSGNFWAYAGLFIRASLYLWSGEALKGRGGETLSGLFKLGIVAGIFEVLVDWGLIHWVSNGRLVYLTGNDVVLLGSPVWMPLAWACVIVELGYPALRLYGLFRAKMTARRAGLVASLMIALAASVTVGFYEYFAYRAGWWKYERANAMIGDFCALYIPLGEFFMFLVILPIAASAFSKEDRRLAPFIEGGGRFAAAIALGYTLAYLLIEAGRTP